MKITPILLAALASAVASAAVAGEPMDLARLEARWVAARFVVSGPLEASPRFSRPMLAWYEPGPDAGQRTVTVPAGGVERVLFADRRPVRGSFSDFVWVFDGTTGEVVSASLAGALDEPVRLGPFRSSARVTILIGLSTRTRGGYLSPRTLVGRTVVGYCRDPEKPGCTPVAGSAYDADSGYVNAVGPVCATWLSRRTLAYARLGQARFRELEPEERRPPAGPGRAGTLRQILAEPAAGDSAPAAC